MKIFTHMLSSFIAQENKNQTMYKITLHSKEIGQNDQLTRPGDKDVKQLTFSGCQDK